MNEKGKGIISYIFGFIGAVIVLAVFKGENNKRTTIHACQSIVITVGVIAIDLVYSFIPFSIPFFSTAVSILEIVLIVMGIVKVAKEQEPELPIIGGITKTIFAKLIDEAPEEVKKEETKDNNKNY